MKTSARIKLLSICIIGLLTAPPTMAFAGPEEAAEYYDQASKAYQDGAYEKAAKLLRRAFAEDSNLIYKYNRILALQAMGDIDTALEELDIWENRMREDGRFDDITEIRAQLEKAQAKAKAREQKDATADRQTDGDAGPDASKGGDKAPGDKVAGGDNQVEPVEPVANGPNYLGWSLVGVGVVGIGVGTLFGSKVLISDVADRNECMQPDGTGLSQCYGDFEDPKAQYNSDRDAWNTNRMLNWTFLGLGTAALIGGGTVLFMDDRSDSEADVAASADQADVSFSPYVGADGAGGVLHISF